MPYEAKAVATTGARQRVAATDLSVDVEEDQLPCFALTFVRIFVVENMFWVMLTPLGPLGLG